MDWSETIREEREMLKRIIALFCALARLTDGVCHRSYPVRCFILWLLRPAIVIALNNIADTGPVHPFLIWRRTDSIAEAERYSRCFRAAARSLKRQIKELGRYEAYVGGDPILLSRPPVFSALLSRRFADLLACLRNLATAQAGQLRHASMSALLVPEFHDTS